MARPSPAPTPVEAPVPIPEVSLPPIPERAEFRSAIVETIDVDKAKTLRRFEPRYDESTRTVTGVVDFQGLENVLINCPGGSHATIRLTVMAAIP